MPTFREKILSASGFQHGLKTFREIFNLIIVNGQEISENNKIIDWAIRFKEEHPIGIIIDDININDLALRSVIFYSGYNLLEYQINQISSAKILGIAPIISKISLNTLITVSEWAMIRPLFMLYVERETALHLEASRGMGADVYGRTVAEVEQDIDRMEAGYHQSTFCEEMIQI